MHWKQKHLVFELDVCAIGTQRLDIVNAVAFRYKYVSQDAGLSRCLIQPQHQVNKNLFLESEHAVETKAVGVSKHNPFGQVCCSILNITFPEVRAVLLLSTTLLQRCAVVFLNATEIYPSLPHAPP